MLLAPSFASVGPWNKLGPTVSCFRSLSPNGAQEWDPRTMTFCVAPPWCSSPPASCLGEKAAGCPCRYGAGVVWFSEPCWRPPDALVVCQAQVGLGCLRRGKGPPHMNKYGSSPPSSIVVRRPGSRPFKNNRLSLLDILPLLTTITTTCVTTSFIMSSPNTVTVKNIASATSDKEIKDFFSFW